MQYNHPPMSTPCSSSDPHHHPDGGGAHPPQLRILPAALVRLYTITAIAMVAMIISCHMAAHPQSPTPSARVLLARSNYVAQQAQPITNNRTLIAYVFAANDPEYETNLRYFLRHGVSSHPCCDYAVILNHEPTQAPPVDLPPLPMGSSYIQHTNECYDMGTIGWAIAHGYLAPQRYRYFMLINSSVRGPFVPAYWPQHLHWSHAFTSKLQGDVKLVGPTINCESYMSSDGQSVVHNPHVQTYAAAMDQVAYQLLQRNGSVFACQPSLQDTVFHAEFGASRVLLDVGYNIDSLMLRYQGIDWRNRSNWGCNGGTSPVREGSYDGISVNPLEVMFIKTKAFTVSQKHATARMVLRYHQWADEGTHNVSSNRAVEDSLLQRLQQTWALRQRDPHCLDVRHYLRHSTDLPREWGGQEALMHLARYGQFEQRPFRFTCDDIALFDPIDHREPLYPGITAAPVPAAVGDDGLPYTGGVAALYKEGAMEGPAAT